MGDCSPLMALRTAMPLVVLSALFGVNETTGGRAFTTWLNFMHRSMRPLMRLPTREEVDAYAHDNFLRQGWVLWLWFWTPPRLLFTTRGRLR